MNSPEQLPTQQKQRNVLIAVDIQNDFISGSLAVPGGAEVVEPINSLAQEIRDQNGEVIFTRDWHPAETPHFEQWPVHCVAGTKGAAFADRLIIKDADTVLSKGMEQTDGYSGAEGISDDGRNLEQLISVESAEKTRIFIGGLATDYCVKATAVDTAEIYSSNDDVEIYLIRNAIRAVNTQASDEQTALDAIKDAGVLAISSKEALSILRSLEV